MVVSWWIVAFCPMVCREASKQFQSTCMIVMGHCSKNYMYITMDNIEKCEVNSCSISRIQEYSVLLIYRRL